jgi:hypothetical protein
MDAADSTDAAAVPATAGYLSELLLYMRQAVEKLKKNELLMSAAWIKAMCKGTYLTQSLFQNPPRHDQPLPPLFYSAGFSRFG